MKHEDDLVLNTFVKSRLGIGLPPKPRPLTETGSRSLTTDTDRITSVKGSLFSDELEGKDLQYVESVLQEVGNDLDQMIDCIEDYKHLLARYRKVGE